VTESPRREHYSYTAYADPAMARTFDDRRFGGPIGALVAATQARVLANMIGRVQRRRILDVGTGTGRAALLLSRGGAEVTGVDASEQMLAVAKKRAEEEGLGIRFLLGDARTLDFPDRSFDVAISLRVLMHTPDWRRCLQELCRVADQLVIIDYPSAASAALLQSLGRKVADSLGMNTELQKRGFRVRSVHRQFVLPIAVHKAIGSQRFTRICERLLERAGLLRLFGSPVTLVAERCEFS
jgi:SAM-dependent methyltransferase